MLPNKYNINIGVYGQVVGVGGADDTALAFSYPTPTTAIPSQSWVKSLFDPRDARNFTPKGEDAFAFWANSDGNFYAIIFRSADARNGRLMLVINVKDGMSNSGAEALRTLRSLKKSYIECSNGKLFNDEIDARLASFRNSLISYNNYAPLAKVPQNKGYRVFTNEAQLAEMFTFPHQSESATYQCVYFVPNEITQFDPNFVKITTPVIVSYHIEKQPGDVSINPSRSVFSKGETLSITYKKDGCEPETRVKKIDGISNDIITYSGYAIQIKDATSAGIRFKYKVYITFVKEGTQSPIFDVKINYENQKSSSPISVPEGYTNNIVLSASKNGYQTTSFTLTKQDLEAKKATIPMKPITKPGGNGGYGGNGGNGGYSGNGGNGSGYGNGGNRGNRRKDLVIGVLGGIALTVSLFLIYRWFSQSESPEPTPPKPQTTVAKNTTDSILIKKNREADLDYLKKNDEWDKSKLKSNEFKVLIDYIINKQVDSAFNCSYSQEQKINGHWKNSFDIYKDIKNRVDPGKLRQVFKDANHYDIINVEKLASGLTTQQKNLNKDLNPSAKDGSLKSDNRHNGITLESSTKTNTGINPGGGTGAKPRGGKGGGTGAKPRGGKGGSTGGGRQSSDY